MTWMKHLSSKICIQAYLLSRHVIARILTPLIVASFSSKAPLPFCSIALSGSNDNPGNLFNLIVLRDLMQILSNNYTNKEGDANQLSKYSKCFLFQGVVSVNT